jgi:DNA-binding transcriptional LysR family regulator
MFKPVRRERAVTVPAGGPLRTRLKARQLALLVALAEHRSLRRAAAEIAVSQPAATKLLHDLEDVLGVPLFDRHSWGMEPTLFGDAMIRCARGVLTDLAEARDELAALASGAGGRLRVGVVTGAVPRLLVPALHAIRASAPGLKTYVLVNANEVLASGLRQGTLDVAIGALPAHEDAGALVAEPLADEPLCVVGGPAHGVRSARGARAVALARATWVLPPPGNPLRMTVETYFAGAGQRLPADLIETVSIVATLALLQQRGTLSVLPVDLARHYEARGMLRPLAVALPPGGGSYALLTRATRRLSPAAHGFVEAVRAIARSGQGEGPARARQP